MSSTALAALEGLKQNDYLTIALFTVIAYDYVLTLPTEIDYIWNKRWTLVSALFLLVRYCGLYILITYTLLWSSFLPGPVKVIVSKSSDIPRIHPIQRYFQGEILYVASIWAFVVWIGASDLVMILRVWAMYNRSRVILGVLLMLWSIELILSLLACIMYPKHITVAVTQVSYLAYCGVTSASVTWTKVSAIPEIINSAIICVLVLFRFVKRALEMYSVTKRWHFNRYMNLFAGQSILYFLFIVFFNRTAILVAEGNFQTEGWSSIVLLPLEYVPAFALTPRFIMSVRALRPNETQESHGRDTEGTFGMTGSRHGDRSYTTMLDIRSSETIEHDESIPMERWSLTAERL